MKANKLSKVLASRYTEKQFEFIQNDPKKSALLRELLQGYIDSGNYKESH